MKIIFMGSAAFAVPSLGALLKSKHELQLVICQPDKPAGRGLKIHPCLVAVCAHENGLPTYQPTTLRNGSALKRLSDLKPDLIVVVAYGKILPNEILDVPPRGCINVHASLLPKYRGAAPINWAITNGEMVTGVTTMMINEQMDAGDILLQKETPIGAQETSIELHDRLSQMGADLLIETLCGIKNKAIRQRPQVHELATYAPLLKKEDGLIEWKKGAREISNLIRGMQPWPVAYTYLDGKMLRIFGAVPTREPHSSPPGSIVCIGDRLGVATGNGTLYLTEVQLEGKKRMSIDAFLRGHAVGTETALKGK